MFIKVLETVYWVAWIVIAISVVVMIGVLVHTLCGGISGDGLSMVMEVAYTTCRGALAINFLIVGGIILDLVIRR